MLLKLSHSVKIYEEIGENGTYYRLGRLLDNPVTENIVSLFVFFEHISVQSIILVSYSEIRALYRQHFI
jgi:hypothetical protein